MILVDTSVLIDYLKDKDTQAVSYLDNIIANDIPFGICSFIYQEVLQGAKTDKEFNTLKTYLRSLPFYHLKHGLDSYERVAQLNFKCRRAGVTVRSSIDLLISGIAIENELYLLHSDKDFDFIANVVDDLKVYQKSVH